MVSHSDIKIENWGLRRGIPPGKAGGTPRVIISMETVGIGGVDTGGVAHCKIGLGCSPEIIYFTHFGQSQIFLISLFKSTLTSSPCPFNICTTVLYTHSLFVFVFLLHLHCHQPTSQPQLMAQHHPKLSFKYFFLQKSFHPLHCPNSVNCLLPLLPSITSCLASPLACLTTHQKDAIYKPCSCQHRLLHSLLDLEEDFIVMHHRIVSPFILVLECITTPLYFNMVSHGHVHVCCSQWLHILFHICTFESLVHPTILLFHTIISTWF